MRALALALVLCACNPYDPYLGDKPFQCGTEEPRCPDGYIGVDVSPVRCECLRAAIAFDASGPYECSDDLQEPNNSGSAPFQTGIDEIAPNKNFPISSICPAGDEDYLEVTVPRPGTQIRVETHFDLSRQAPTITILRAIDGTTVNSSTGVPTPGTITTVHTTNSMGTYQVLVRAPQEVNYDIRIQLVF